jgi:hypothetical protein
MRLGKAARPAAHDAREPRRVDDLLGSKFDTEATSSAPTLQYRQGDLFDPLVGLAVIAPSDKQHGTAAFVGRNQVVLCACHGESRGQLSDSDASLIFHFISEFGSATVPIALRYPLISASGVSSC